MLRALLAALALAFAVPAQAGSGAAPSDPGYLIVVGQSFDRAKMGRYAASLPPVYAKHQGYYLGIGGPGRGVTWIDGPWRDRSLVVARFPARADVDAFWWDQDYRRSVTLREGGGVFSVVALPSLGPTPFEGAGAGYLVVMLSSADAARGQAAGARLAAAVAASGGAMAAADRPAPLEGDTVFDRVWVAAWPTKAARDAFVESRQGKAAARAWRAAGFAVAATLDGVARTAPPPAAANAAR